MWSARVLAKYWALQLPFTAALVAALLFFEDDLGGPGWLPWAIVAAWVGKDAVLYPFVWRAYDSGAPARLPYPMEGAAGVALERIDPRGRVRCAGELWRAELAPGARPIEDGAAVRVVARRRTTLLVEPA